MVEELPYPNSNNNTVKPVRGYGTKMDRAKHTLFGTADDRALLTRPDQNLCLPTRPKCNVETLSTDPSQQQHAAEVYSGHHAPLHRPRPQSLSPGNAKSKRPCRMSGTM